MTDVHIPDAPATPPVIVQTGDGGGAVVAGELERVHQETAEAQAAAGQAHEELAGHAVADASEHVALAEQLAAISARLDAIDQRTAERAAAAGTAVGTEAAEPVQGAEEASGATSVEVTVPPVPEVAAAQEAQAESKKKRGLPWLRHPMESRRR